MRNDPKSAHQIKQFIRESQECTTTTNEYILMSHYMGKVKQVNQMFRGIELKQNNADGESR